MYIDKSMQYGDCLVYFMYYVVKYNFITSYLCVYAFCDYSYLTLLKIDVYSI